MAARWRGTAPWAVLAAGLSGLAWLQAGGGWPAWAVLAVVLGAALVTTGDGSGPPEPPVVRERLWVSGVVLVALVLRVWRIGDLPPGLWLDEGRSGWWAGRFLAGESWWGQPFAPEPLQIYLFGYAFKWFGFHLAVSRTVVALVGTATVGLLWWAVRPVYGPRVALAAAACLALSRWDLLVSRIAFQVFLLVFFQVLVFGTAVRAFRTARRGPWIALGLALGLGLYGYAPTRAFPAVLAATVGLAVLAGWMPASRLVLAGLGALAMGLVAGPAAMHFARQPVLLTDRLTDLARPFWAHPLAAGAEGMMNLVRWLFRGGVPTEAFNFPWPAEAAGISLLGGALLLVGLPRVLARGDRVWNVLVALSVLSAVVVCAVTGMSGFRVANLLPFVCLAQGLAVVGLADATRAPGFAAAVLGLGLAWQECPGFLAERFWTGDRSRIAWEFRVGDRVLADRVAALAGSRPLFFSPDTAFPSDRAEMFTSNARFLLHDRVGRDVPPDPAWLCRRGGSMVFLFTTREREELLTEVYPGGVLLDGHEAGGTSSGARAYVIGCPAGPRMPFQAFRDLVLQLDAVDAEMERSEFRSVATQMTGAIARWPRVSAPYAARAVARLELGEAGPARADALRAVALSAGRNTRALDLLGLIAAREGAFTAAARWWRRSLDLDPGREDVWRNLVLAQGRAGQARVAAASLAAARRYFPGLAVSAGSAP